MTREKRRFWAVTDWGVSETVGFSCAPSNPEMWWCPSVGFSGTYKCHLFDTEGEALNAAITKFRNEKHDLEEIIAKLEAKRLSLL